MTPFLAQGAAQAIEDADALARRLGETDDVEAALAAYSDDRVARANRVQREATMQGRIYHLSGPFALARDLTMRALGPEGVLKRLGWLYAAWTAASPAAARACRAARVERQDRPAGDQTPERAADAEEADAGGGDEEGRQRRLALVGVGERAVQRAAEGVEQRQAGDRLDQDRRAGDEMGDAARQQAKDDASRAVARRGDPAPRGIGRGVLAGAQARR